MWYLKMETSWNGIRMNKFIKDYSNPFLNLHATDPHSGIYL